MIPLVSAVRELELLKRYIDTVAAEVRSEMETAGGEMVDYQVGVMIETPVLRYAPTILPTRRIFSVSAPTT